MKCLAGKEPELVSEVDPQFDGTGVTLMHIWAVQPVVDGMEQTGYFIIILTGKTQGSKVLEVIKFNTWWQGS